MSDTVTEATKAIAACDTMIEMLKKKLEAAEKYKTHLLNADIEKLKQGGVPWIHDEKGFAVFFSASENRKVDKCAGKISRYEHSFDIYRKHLYYEDESDDDTSEE